MLYYNKAVEESLRWMDRNPTVVVELIGDNITKLPHKSFVTGYHRIYNKNSCGFTVSNRERFKVEYPRSVWSVILGAGWCPVVVVKGLQVLDLRNNLLLRFLYEPHEAQRIYRGDTLCYERGSITFTLD